MINHNKLLRANIGIISGKTGFTKVSGRCLVTCAQKDNFRLIAVTLNAPNDWQDHTRLYDFGFSNYQIITLGSIYYTIPVVSGNKNEIEATSLEISLVLPRSAYEVNTEIKAPRFLYGSIKSGEQIGTVIYKYNGKIIAYSPLITTEGVEQKKYKFNLFLWLIDLIKGLIK
jgi:D-alanyl-D-alanine carboxypeptidase/D-alanyl-D-alanine carboxypeptidase (penicillin-binding protein 5/6)